MEKNRIYFKDNPWPEGHPIKKFTWTTRVEKDYVWFDMHLETENYYSERDIEDDDEVEYLSDWSAPIVWGNYHSCIMSSSNWHKGGFKLCSLEEYSPEYLDGLELSIDSTPEAIDDRDELAFHIYLLGHDAVAKHMIRFERVNGSKVFNISWSGKIALAYAGDYEFRYEFLTFLTGVNFPEVGSNV